MLLDKSTAGARWHLRPDGFEKVTGQLKYLTDLKVPGMLYGKVLRSAMPHAQLLSIRTARAEVLAGVHAVLTHKDVPGLNRFGIVVPDQPVLCEDRVRYIGDAIAAVAAESPEIATQALSLIEVDYVPLPVVDSPDAALRAEAPLLHPQGNVLHRTHHAKGDVETAFHACVHIVEATYRTPRQMHGYMETEGGLFTWDADGRLTVQAATQHGYKDRMQLSRILAVPEEMIRVISSPIGGSFGGKDELNVQPYGALLALRTGRPVKLHHTRRESVRAGLKRHPMEVTMKTGIDADGKLLAHSVWIIADTGAYATLGAPVLNFATEHAMGPYRIEHVLVEGRSVFTNNGVSGEFRGFGGNQVIFALESQIDRLAALSGIPPWELRRRNLREPTDPGPLGNTVMPTDGAAQVWREIQTSELWRAMELEGGETHVPDRPWLHLGFGAAMAMHGSGLGYGIPDPGGGRLGLNAEGKLEAAFSFEEFGQGITATLEIMLMELFGCDAEDLHLILGDTDKAPHSGSSTASRSTTIAHLTLSELHPKLTAAMLVAAAEASGHDAACLVTGRGGIWLRDGEGPVISYRELAARTNGSLRYEAAVHFPATPDPVTGAHFLYTCTAAAVRVEVDTRSGIVRVLEQAHAVAAGPVVNPMGFIGQIEGGASMALGFTLMEDALMEDACYRTENLDTYMLPTIADSRATFNIHAIEELPPGDPYGPRGIGEVGSVALAPAITAAIYHAIGRRIDRLPVRREDVIMRFAEQTGGEET